MMNALRNLIFRDFWLKLFSLILALGVWKVVSKASENNPSPPGSILAPADQEKVFVGVKVHVIPPVADTRDFKVEPGVVDITVRGESQFLETIKPADIRANIYLPEIESSLSTSNRIEVSIPAGLTLMECSPPSADVLVSPKN